MKFFFFLFFAVVAANCTTPGHSPVEPGSSPYLSKEEVLDLFKGQQEDTQAITMTPEIIHRIDNLDNEVDFLKDLKDLPIDEAPEGFMESRSVDGIDLRKYANKTIHSQINGRCTAYGMAATLEAANCIQNKYCDHKLSESHSWAFDSNYSCKTKVDSHLKNYIALSKYWHHNKSIPEVYDINERGFVKIKHGWYFGKSQDKVITALSNRHPVYIGMRTPSSMVKCNKAVKFSPGLDGGHALSVLGYYHYPKETDLKYILILKNSWGENCGDRGYQYMPLKICSSKGYYCMFWAFDKLDVITKNSK